MQILSAVNFGFQALAAGAGIGKVATENRVTVSRCCNLASVAAVTAGFAVQYANDGSSAHLSGMLSFGVLSTRTALNLLYQFKENGRRIVTATAAVAATALSVGGQLAVNHHYDPVTLLSMGGVWIGCLADYSNDMKFRRRCFLIMGLSTSSFGILTHAWGLVAKNLISDAGASAYYMWKYNDPLARRPYLTIKQYVQQALALKK